MRRTGMSAWRCGGGEGPAELVGPRRERRAEGGGGGGEVVGAVEAGVEEDLFGVVVADEGQVAAVLAGMGGGVLVVGEGVAVFGGAEEAGRGQGQRVAAEGEDGPASAVGELVGEGVDDEEADGGVEQADGRGLGGGGEEGGEEKAAG